MALTYFLAQLIGLYLLIVGLLMLFRKKMFLGVIQEFYERPSSMFIAGWLAMVLGLMLVLSYSYWNAGILALVITLAGWAALLKGAMLLLFPKAMVRFTRVFKLEKFFYLYAIIVLIIGAYLTHAGFTHVGLLH